MVTCEFALAEYIFFYTIVTSYNGSLAADIAHIDVATHMEVTKFGATLRSN